MKSYHSFSEHLLNTGWAYSSHGRHRNVFIRNDVVIKIPIDITGVHANKCEYELYRWFKNKPDDKTGAYYAPCRLLVNDCLMMRRLYYIYDECGFGSLPSYWCNNLYDGPQVGTDKNGSVFAYDYADEYKQ